MRKKENLSEKMKEKDCYGCSACYTICPHAAITMKENRKGFLYPVIDNSICNNCGLCEKVCRQDNEYFPIKDVFIAKHNDKRVFLLSQSGGAFTALSDIIWKDGGAVYGASLDKTLEAVHIRAITSRERDSMRGSKYIQSRMEDCYKMVEQDLKNRKVLFSGTPCQVGGLLKYLKIKKVDPCNLYTVDLICHGVPSIRIWRDLIQYYEAKEKEKVQRVVFRDKSVGGGYMGRPYYQFLFKKKRISDSLHRNFFYTNLALRDSCYDCEYAKKERVGDITIGDAWNVKENDPDFYDSKGVSLLLLQTEKGEELFQKAKKEMKIRNVELYGYLQGNMQQSSKPHRSVEEFWKDYEKRSFRFMIEKYAKNNIFLNSNYIIKVIKRKLKLSIKTLWKWGKNG